MSNRDALQKKQEYRHIIDERMAQLSPEEAAREDAALCRAVLADPRWQKANAIFAYYPMPKEPDLLPLLEAALAEGKRLYLPAVIGDGLMEPRRVRDLSRLVPGKYGIPEPDGDALTAAGHEIDLVILPGVAFDPQTRVRLGRGGGFYDRWLEANPHVHTLAPARRCQLITPIPAQLHDSRADRIITAEEDQIIE